MKNQIFKVLTVCFALGLAINSNGQSSGKTWSFGPEAGVNFAKFGRDADNTEFNTGLVAGGFLTYSIQDTYAFTLKVLHSQKGAAEESTDSKLHLNYVEVPLLFRFFLNKEGAIRPNAFVGPSFGFLTEVKSKVGDGDYESVQNFEDSYNNFDVGVGFGLGINFRVANEMYFIIDTRYTYGFSDISKSPADVNNQALAFTAGLSFGLNKN